MASSLQDGADPQAGGQRQRAGDEAAGKAAEQQRRQPDALDDRRIFVARKAEIDDEGRGHGAGQRVGELEQHHEGEHHKSHFVAHEILEGADRGFGHAGERSLVRMRASAARERSGSVATSAVKVPISTSAAIAQ